MAVTNPCCGCTLQTGTKIVAIVDIVFSSIGILILLIQLLGVGIATVVVATADSRDGHRSETRSQEQADLAANNKAILAERVVVAFVITVAALIGFILDLVIAIVLLMGASNREVGKCRFWFIVTVLLTLFYILRSIESMVSYGIAGAPALIVGETFGLLIMLLIVGYQLLVVHCFMKELKEGGTGSAAAYVVGSGGQPGYVYTKPAEPQAPGAPPPYGQQGYAPVPLNYPAPGPAGPAGFAYPRLDEEKGTHP